MEELEKTPPLRNNDVASFDRFTDLVRVTVAKLNAEGRETELGEGSLHGQLVKKLSGLQVESYRRWLNVHNKTPSVTNLYEWLKKEVAIKMEAVEMAHWLEHWAGARSMPHWSWKNDGKSAKEKKLCFRCLSKDHHGKDCRRTGRCGINGCSSSHHHLLHDPERQKGNTASGAPSKGSNPPREGATAAQGF